MISLAACGSAAQHECAAWPVNLTVHYTVVQCNVKPCLHGTSMPDVTKLDTMRCQIWQSKFLVLAKILVSLEIVGYSEVGYNIMPLIVKQFFGPSWYTTSDIAKQAYAVKSSLRMEQSGYFCLWDLFHGRLFGLFAFLTRDNPATPLRTGESSCLYRHMKWRCCLFTCVGNKFHSVMLG